ncbi:unnamed protein product, partial [Brenthis ino]
MDREEKERQRILSILQESDSESALSDQECIEEDHLSERSHPSDTEQEISESDDDDITLSTLSHRNRSPQLEEHSTFGSTSSFYRGKDSTICRDVIIMEDTENSSDVIQAKIEEEQSDNTTEDEETVINSSDVTYIPDETESSSSTSDEYYNVLSDTEVLPDKPTVLDKRQRKQPDRFGFINICIESVGDKNLTYEDVMNGIERVQWCKAMEEELQSFQCIKTELRFKFKIKDHGEIRHCSGMRVRKENNVISIDQEHFVEELLRKFNMKNCNTVSTPMEVNLKLTKENTCPNISYAVCYLILFLKYLKKTKHFGLKYVKDDLDIIGYADAVWASDSLDRKSYTVLGSPLK